MTKYLEAYNNMKKVLKVLGNITCLAGCVPTSAADSEIWKQIERSSNYGRANLYKVLEGNQLISLRELRRVLQASARKGNPNPKKTPAPAAQLTHDETRNGFREQRRRRRNNSPEEELQSKTSKKFTKSSSKIMAKTPLNKK
jgi:hypothetical protein